MPPVRPNARHLQRLTNEISQLQSARRVVVTRLDQDIRITREKAEEIAQAFWSLERPPQMGSGMWECPDSPNGYCWYRAEDHRRDECIICGNPEERK
jgi:hypothetical protein